MLELGTREPGGGSTLDTLFMVLLYSTGFCAVVILATAGKLAQQLFGGSGWVALRRRSRDHQETFKNTTREVVFSVIKFSACLVSAIAFCLWLTQSLGAGVYGATESHLAIFIVMRVLWLVIAVVLLRFKNSCTTRRAAAAADTPFSKAKVEELLEVFKEFDSDGSGRIDGTELHELLTKMGGTVTLAEAQAMIEVVDLNGDGAIDFMEFVNLVQQDQKKGGKSTGFMNVVKVRRAHMLRKAIEAASKQFASTVAAVVVPYTAFSIYNCIGAVILSSIESGSPDNAEDWDFFGSYFYCFTLATTVGFGAFAPVTAAGKWWSIVHSLGGLIVFALTCNHIADALLQIIAGNVLTTVSKKMERLILRRRRDHLSKAQLAGLLVQAKVNISPSDLAHILEDIQGRISDESIVQSSYYPEIARRCACVVSSRYKFIASLIFALFYLLYMAATALSYKTAAGIDSTFLSTFYYTLITTSTVGLGDELPSVISEDPYYQQTGGPKWAAFALNQHDMDILIGLSCFAVLLKAAEGFITSATEHAKQARLLLFTRCETHDEGSRQPEQVVAISQQAPLAQNRLFAFYKIEFNLPRVLGCSVLMFALVVVSWIAFCLWITEEVAAVLVVSCSYPTTFVVLRALWLAFAMALNRCQRLFVRCIKCQSLKIAYTRIAVTLWGCLIPYMVLCLFNSASGLILSSFEGTASSTPNTEGGSSYFSSYGSYNGTSTMQAPGASSYFSSYGSYSGTSTTQASGASTDDWDFFGRLAAVCFTCAAHYLILVLQVPTSSVLLWPQPSDMALSAPSPPRGGGGRLCMPSSALLPLVSHAASAPKLSCSSSETTCARLFTATSSNYCRTQGARHGPRRH